MLAAKLTRPWLPLACVLLAGCGGGSSEASCLDKLPRASAGECTPLVAPEFAELHRQTFASCGAASTGGSCHSASGKQSGLVLETVDAAYDSLLGASGDPRVIPKDPECSLLMKRLESSDPSYRMPRGPTALSAAERCAIIQWIANGAER